MIEFIESAFEFALTYFSGALALVCVCGMFVVPAVILSLVIWRLNAKPAQDHLGQLAAQMGLQPVAPKRGRRFEGQYQNHTFSIGPGARSRGSAPGGRYNPSLSVHLELHTDPPLRGRAGFSGRSAGPADTFESTFRQEAPIERLSPPARAAMLDFARKYDNLWLEAFRPQSTPRLEYTLPDITTATPDTLRYILYDLVTVAQAIEQPPPTP